MLIYKDEQIENNTFNQLQMVVNNTTTYDMNTYDIYIYYMR